MGRSRTSRGFTRPATWAMVVAMSLIATLSGGSVAKADTTEEPSVFMVGITGLLWTDLDAQNTPALWELLGDSAAASMAVRAAGTKTCPDDAWVSIGAGNRGRTNYIQGQVCPLGSLIGPPQQHTDDTWWMPGQTQLDDSNDELSYRTTPGVVADLVGCAAAIGPGAAVAAAHPNGLVDRYRSAIPETAEELADFTSGCPVTMVDLQSPVYGEVDTDTRRRAAAATDEAVSAAIAVIPEDATLLVAGISDATPPANLHPAVLRDSDHADRWLTSAATRRTGYIQLSDIGPTVVTAAGGSVKGSDMTGQPAVATEHRSGDTETTVNTGINANRAGQQIPPLADGFYATLTVLGLIVIAAALVLCRRRRESGDRRLARLLVPVALSIAALPVASILVNAFPWWRTANPGAVLWAIMVTISIALGALATWGPWRRHRLGPATVIAVITAGVIGFDCLTGTHLQFNSLTGYSAITAARFTGMGNYAFGVFAGAAIVAALLATVRLRGWHKPVAISAIAGTAILIDGFPSWGNDVGGVIAMTPAFILAGLHVMGKRLSIKKIVMALMVGVTAITVLMVVDYLRPLEQQTHLGRFIGEVLGGTAGDTVLRKAWAALGTVTSGPLTVLVIAACVAVPLLWHTATVHRVIQRHPAVLSAAIGVATVSVLGFAFNDSGIAVPAFTLAATAPLFAAIAAEQTGPAAIGSGSEELIK